MLVDVQRIPQVGLAFVDEDHREEGRLLNELGDAVRQHRDGRASAESVLHRFEALLAHTQAHFGREEEAMRQSAFPAFPVHKAEHDRVLEEMEAEGEHFRETGDTGRLWRYVSDSVPAWFMAHIESMDHVTAQYIASRGE